MREEATTKQVAPGEWTGEQGRGMHGGGWVQVLQGKTGLRRRAAGGREKTALRLPCQKCWFENREGLLLGSAKGAGSFVALHAWCYAVWLLLLLWCMLCCMLRCAEILPATEPIRRGTGGARIKRAGCCWLGPQKCDAASKCACCAAAGCRCQLSHE